VGLSGSCRGYRCLSPSVRWDVCGLSAVEEVVSRLSSFRVPGFNFRFVDREREARAVLDVSADVVMGGLDYRCLRP
jgi:hypothetical protein